MINVHIFNIFKKRLKQNNNKALVNPQNIYPLPNRKDFKHYDLINKQKQEYLQIINNLDYANILALENTRLNEDVQRTIELLLNLFYKEEYINNDLKDFPKYAVNYEKLKLYLNDINNLLTEVIVRIFALKDISHRLISRRVKNSLKLTLDRLYIIYNVILAEKEALRQNILNYTSTYSKITKYIKENNITNTINIKNINHLNWLKSILPIDKQVNIQDEYDFKNKALLEKNMETFTYQKKQELIKEVSLNNDNIDLELLLEKAKQAKIERIFKIPFKYENKDLLLEEINNLEKHYRMFYEFGRNFITDADLAQVYSLKFSALILSPNQMALVNAFKYADELAYQNYEKVIFNMLEDIIKGNNKVFVNIFKDNLEEALNLVKNIFKRIYYVDKETIENDNYLDFNYILKEYGLLNFLLALSYEEGLDNFFHNFYIENKIDSNATSLIFEFAQLLPLETICYVLDALNKPIYLKSAYLYKPYLIDKQYYDLYKLYQKHFSKDKFYLPDGIISLENFENLSNFDEKLRQKINRDTQGKVVFFPKSLKILDSVTSLLDYSVKDVVLNEGLEELNTLVFKNTNISKLNIPSSVKRLYLSPLVNNIDTLIININKDKQYLLEENNLRKLLKNSQNKNLIIHIENLHRDIKISLEVPANVGNKEDYIINSIKDKFLDLKNEYLKMQVVLPKEKQLDFHFDSLTSFIKALENLEQVLNDYAFQNKEEAPLIFQEIEKDIRLALAHKKDINSFNDLKILEAKCNLFYHYKLIDENTLKSFYLLRYILLTSFTNEFIYYLPQPDTTDFERNCYLTEMDVLVKFNFYQSLSFQPITSLTLNLLANGKKKINELEVLDNYYLYNLFLALKEPLNLIKFANHFKISSSLLPQSKEKVFTLAEEIPLGSLILLKSYLILVGDNSFIPFTYFDKTYKLDKNFAKLYHLIYLKYYDIWFKKDISSITSLKKAQNYFYLPEGITKSDTTKCYYSSKDFLDNHLLNNLTHDSINKIVVMPSTLKELKGPLFKSIKVKDIILNEGLENLDLAVFSEKDIDTLIIPSSVKKIQLNHKCNYQFKTIIFNNFKFDNIIVLQNILSLILVKCSFTKLEKISFHYDDLPEDIVINIKDILDLSLDSIIDKILENMEKQKERVRNKK